MKKLHDLASDLKEKIEEAAKAYKYQPTLTSKLDNHIGDFTETTLLEIVLWKTNRYPIITKKLLADVNDLRNNYSADKARNLLRKMLQKESKGFDLPMASTVLRFACPDQLQIIDQRVYRFITPGKDCLRMPYNIDEKIDLYFKYIERLKEICLELNIPFSQADRLLYQIDKTENKDIPLTTSASRKTAL